MIEKERKKERKKKEKRLTFGGQSQAFEGLNHKGLVLDGVEANRLTAL